MLVGLVIAIAINLRARRAMPPDPRMDEDRETWRMPSLALLTQPVKSRGRLIALCTVRGYAIIAMVSLLVKTILASRRRPLATGSAPLAKGVTQGRPGRVFIRHAVGCDDHRRRRHRPVDIAVDARRIDGRITSRGVIGEHRAHASPWSPSGSPSPAPSAAVHPGAQHRDLGTGVVVEVAGGEHVRCRIELDHAHRPGVVDMGDERALRADPEHIHRVVAARSEGREACRDVGGIDIGEQHDRDLSARPARRVGRDGRSLGGMPVGDRADPAVGGDREPGAACDEVTSAKNQRVRVQHAG